MHTKGELGDEDEELMMISILSFVGGPYCEPQATSGVAGLKLGGQSDKLIAQFEGIAGDLRNYPSLFKTEEVG